MTGFKGHLMIGYGHALLVTSFYRASRLQGLLLGIVNQDTVGRLWGGDEFFSC